MASSPLCPDLPLPFVVAALSRRSSRRAASGRRLSWLSGPGLGPSARTGYGRSHPLPYSTQPHPLLCSALLSFALLSSPSPLFSSRPLTVSSPSRHRPLSSPLRLHLRLLSSPLLSSPLTVIASLHSPSSARPPTNSAPSVSVIYGCVHLHARRTQAGGWYSYRVSKTALNALMMNLAIEGRQVLAGHVLTKHKDRAAQAHKERQRKHRDRAAGAQGQCSGSTGTGQREHKDRAAGAHTGRAAGAQGRTCIASCRCPRSRPPADLCGCAGRRAGAGGRP